MFRQIWIPIIFMDEACTQEALAVSALHMQQLYHDNEEALQKLRHAVVGYRSAALVSINNRLRNIETATSDGVIAAIISFACNGGLYDDWNIHMAGLRRIIELRGGLDTLANNPSLRLMVSCVDIGGAAVWDTTPFFPWPEQSPVAATVSTTTLPLPISEHIESVVERLPGCASLFKDVKTIVMVIQDLGKSLQHDVSFWEEQYMESGTRLAPAAHGLLSARRDDIFADSNSRNHETLRLAALLFMAALRRQIGFQECPSQPWIDRLIEITGHCYLESNDPDPVMAMQCAAVLVIGHICSQCQDDRDYLLGTIMTNKRIHDAAGFLLVQEWNKCIQLVFGQRMAELQIELSAHDGFEL
ncbi:hypothetical protein K431DRAFT_165912 [Polychaeton citri CBS 116435]|uniref:Transcription factor domain-containing protein n=1 Tax=Polychaeton citri CBS 116435 TaxID=1314669 RepID=A0A9P4USX5_9PEZI|nr:hypothetical protein K431DRAFT_165912 [Polychaeton citri CBS 116435]